MACPHNRTGACRDEEWRGVVTGERLTDQVPGELNRLTGLCSALGAPNVGELSRAERALLRAAEPPEPEQVEAARQEILAGRDYLGQWFCEIVPAEQRRSRGQTYTPAAIIESMVDWARDQGAPTRIVDPGAGSGRYVIAVARAFPGALVVAAEIDPVATLMIRANAAVWGVGDRVEVVLGDYRALELPDVSGPTLFIGNPPYVRHHKIEPEWKAWLTATARKRGLPASALAGLHVHFFLATAEHGRPGDYGAFITSSEWLDVNYGRLVRGLLVHDLGVNSLHVLDPRALPFAATQVTGAIACFRIGSATPTVRMRQVDSAAELGRLSQGREIPRDRLAAANRWSVLMREPRRLPAGNIELGELVRVHRGAVTGANRVWVTQATATDLPASVLYPSVTKAHELFSAGERLADANDLKVVIDLPIDLDGFDRADRRRINRFLKAAREACVDLGYVASSRKAWWSIGLRAPAPILATYMARRPPTFVRNDAAARHINIAHGLYPRQELSDAVLDRLAAHLRTSVSMADGRTYAGGLTKFEPKEMERLAIPSLDELERGA
jgi:hypothetical protein